MEPETIHGVTVDVCTRCHGLWLTGDSLKSLLDAGPLNAGELKHLGDQDVTQIKQESSHMVCPDHGVPLDIYHYMYSSPLELHVCPTDGGTWIAAGELQQLEQWRLQTDGPQTRSEALAEAAGAAEAQEVGDTARWQNFGTLMNIFNRWSPGWIF